jgi:hypothetical protein
MTLVQSTTRVFLSIALSLSLAATLLPLSLAAQTGDTLPPAEPLTEPEAAELFRLVQEQRAFSTIGWEMGSATIYARMS